MILPIVALDRRWDTFPADRKEIDHWDQGSDENGPWINVWMSDGTYHGWFNDHWCTLPPDSYRGMDRPHGHPA